ncbi:MAG TPA: biopolymer transporter ExbD [Rectinemataceae bacterium]|nr:biopolymer transporter ExbD [Rectinemataceae bacterium]
MRLERRLRVKTAIDMTPLVDVILMLVMFFLITSTFKTSPGIQLSLPTSSTARPIAQEPLKVVVVSASEIHVGSAIADINGLPEAIAREIARTEQAAAARQSGVPGKAAAATPQAVGAAQTAATPQAAGPSPAGAPQRRAIVEAADTVPYQLLVSVLDALRREGVGAVGLATRIAPAGGGTGK